MMIKFASKPWRKAHDRRGVIEICPEIFDGDFKQLYKVFAKFIPVHCEYDFIRSVFVYKGYSKYFDIVSEGELIPKYQVILENKRVTFNRI